MKSICQLRCLLAVLLYVVCGAAWSANLTLSPASGQNGTRVKLSADRLVASTSYEVQFVGSSTVALGNVTSNSSGVASQLLVLPNLPAGRGSIRLRRPLTLVTAASAPFTALAGMQAQLPSQAHAGQRIAFSVSGLSAGSLSVLYEGKTIFGPVPISSTSYAGKLVLPRDRPSPLPADASVVFRNSLGRISINQVTNTLRVLPPALRPFALAPTLSPPASAQPGQRFNVSGKLNLVANEEPPEALSTWMVTTDGQVYPLASTPVRRSGNDLIYAGQVAQGGITSMTAGQAAAGQVFINGSSRGTHGVRQVGEAFNSTVSVLPPDQWRVRVQVRGPSSQPIANAVVLFENSAVVEVDNNGELQFYSVNVQSAVNGLSLTQVPATDAYGCPLTITRGKTDANGIIEFILDDTKLALATTRVVITQPQGNHTYSVRLRMFIDAGLQGYGDVVGGDFSPRSYDFGFVGANDSNNGGESISVYPPFAPDDAVPLTTSNSRNITYPVTLPVITQRMTLFDQAMLPALAVRETGVGGRLIFGPTHNQRQFPSQLAVLGGNDYPAQFSVRLDPIVAGQANFRKVRLDINRNGSYQSNEIIDFPSVPAANLNCSADGLGANQTYTVNFNSFPVNWKEQVAGLMNGEIEFRSPSGGTDIVKIAIQFLQRDLQYLAAATYSEQRISLSGAGQKLDIYAEAKGYDNDVQLPSDPGYRIGFLPNKTDHTEITRIEFGGQTEPLYKMRSLFGVNQALGQVSDSTLSEPEIGAVSEPRVLEILDESFPLFYYVWGVPLLAGVEVGANFAAAAKITFEHEVKLQAQKLITKLTTTPEVDMGLDFYVDLDILFDLVDGGVDLYAGVAIDMPVRVVNGVAQPPQATIDPVLVFSWYFEFFCLPLDVICEAITDVASINGSEQLLPTNSNNRSAKSTRPLLFQRRFHQAVAYSPSGGDGMLLRTVGSTGVVKLFAQEIDGADFERERTVLSSAPGIRSLAVSYIDSRRALAVWAESADPYDTLKMLPPQQRLTRQRLMYALWDGENWSGKQILTSPSFGEGGVSLAVCRAITCTRSREVLAVWTRGKTADIRDHRTQIMYAQFDGSNWSAASAVDPRALLDSSPSAAYVGADPYVAFVRSTNGVFGDTQNRRVAYRNLRNGTVQVPANLPAGVAWPSIQASSNTSFIIAHTHADDPDAFVGNTQRVALAFGDACTAGTCTLTAQTLTDNAGRAIYGERPTVMLDGDNNVEILLRGVGFSAPPAGQNRPREGDPIGMVLHTGELIQLAVQRGQTQTMVMLLSADGAGHLAPVGAFDPELGQFVAISGRGSPVPARYRQSLAKAGMVLSSARAAERLVDDTIGIYTAEQGMDLAVEQIQSNLSALSTGSSLTLRVLVRNAGAPYAATAAPWQVGLSFDAPYDAGGVRLGVRDIPALASGAASSLSITTVLPTGFRPDRERTLFVTLLRNDSSESDVADANNALTKDFGGMPIVYGISAASIAGSNFINLNWEAPVDPNNQVAGYRVWYHDGDGDFKHLGSSFELGFLDISASPGVRRSYRVTSYSTGMVESEPSAAANAMITLPDPIFRNGFE